MPSEVDIFPVLTKSEVTKKSSKFFECIKTMSKKYHLEAQLACLPFVQGNPMLG